MAGETETGLAKCLFRGFSRQESKPIGTATREPAGRRVSNNGKKANLMANTDPYVLIQGPAWGDVQFYGQWLSTAGEAEVFLQKAYADKQFVKRIERVCGIYMPHFGIAATAMMQRLMKDRMFLLDLNSVDGHDFAMMAEMEFFAQRSQIYQMTLPSLLTLEKVKAAVLNLARTEDEELLHPEHVVTAMPLPDAITLLNRLRAQESFDCNADCAGQANQGVVVHLADYRSRVF
jgi:hypothetical protein